MTPFQEIWIEAADGQRMCALINDSLGWLLYLRESGDAGRHSWNPDYAGPQDATRDYLLNNGQKDEYPLAWAVPTEQVYMALEYFQREQKPPPFIMWLSDSGMG